MRVRACVFVCERESRSDFDLTALPAMQDNSLTDATPLALAPPPADSEAPVAGEHSAFIPYRISHTHQLDPMTQWPIRAAPPNTTGPKPHCCS